MKNPILFLILALGFSASAQDSNSPLVSFEDYERLMTVVKEHRKSRLVDLNTFNEMSKKENVYILDARSKEMYDRKHVKGAIHLNFADFTQENLDALFPDRNATILIYCNNNFMKEIALDLSTIIPDQDFASKVSQPEFDFTPIEIVDVSYALGRGEAEEQEEDIAPKEAVYNPNKPITLALNIPTYLNLYGYGYQNVYELSELISVYDERIEFEGSEVEALGK